MGEIVGYVRGAFENGHLQRNRKIKGRLFNALDQLNRGAIQDLSEELGRRMQSQPKPKYEADFVGTGESVPSAPKRQGKGYAGDAGAPQSTPLARGGGVTAIEKAVENPKAAQFALLTLAKTGLLGPMAKAAVDRMDRLTDPLHPITQAVVNDAARTSGIDVASSPTGRKPSIVRPEEGESTGAVTRHGSPPSAERLVAPADSPSKRAIMDALARRGLFGPEAAEGAQGGGMTRFPTAPAARTGSVGTGEAVPTPPALPGGERPALPPPSATPGPARRSEAKPSLAGPFETPTALPRPELRSRPMPPPWMSEVIESLGKAEIPLASPEGHSVGASTPEVSRVYAPAVATAPFADGSFFQWLLLNAPMRIGSPEYSIAGEPSVKAGATPPGREYPQAAAAIQAAPSSLGNGGSGSHLDLSTLAVGDGGGSFLSQLLQHDPAPTLSSLGDPSRPRSNWETTELPSMVGQHEWEAMEAIHQLPDEHLVISDPNGNVIYGPRKGSPDKIEISAEEERLSRGNRQLHQHPNDLPLSGDDVVGAAYGQCQVVAVTPSRVFYEIIRVPENLIPADHLSPKELRAVERRLEELAESIDNTAVLLRTEQLHRKAAKLPPLKKCEEAAFVWEKQLAAFNTYGIEVRKGSF